MDGGSGLGDGGGPHGQRWERYLRAAVRQGDRPAVSSAGWTDLSRRQRRRGIVADFIRQVAVKTHTREHSGFGTAFEDTTDHGDEDVRRRIDMRTVPAAMLSWLAALVGTALPGRVAMLAGLLCGVLAVLTWVSVSRRRTSPCRPATDRGPHPRSITNSLRASVRPLVPAAVLAIVCGSGILLTAGAQTGMKTQGPIEQAIAASRTVTAVLLIRSDPRAVKGAGGRLMITALLTEATADGRKFQAAAPVLVVADSQWVDVCDGQYIAAAGTLRATDPGTDAVAYFSAKTAPRLVTAETAWSRWPKELRTRWRDVVQSQWGRIWPDAAGLLPGMITGDRSAQPAEMDAAMKRVGLTHLTAVSGANCTLILGGLIYLARCARFPRWLAALLAVGGLGAFVTVVGPDPSVLRAALMGLIGILAMLSGRPKRSSALLAVSVVCLLTADPWLAVDFAFILSVLATLGLVLVGQQCSRWLQTWLPLWLAQAVAIPLTAQLFCAPVIVLLQPQLMTYSLPANMAAAPVIALVTAAGTLGLAMVTLAPWAASVLVFLSGTGAAWVGVVAKFFSGLPGAAVPWPEGAAGVSSMGALSIATVAVLWIGVHHRRFRAGAARVRKRLPPRWQPLAGLPGAVALAAGSGAALGWMLASSGAV
ncbi:ComEC/Rec2 family competence protein [Paeniglutamicibacter antarcticus]|uniref:ComEC/Rec2 family competence protein n=1 Tax=Arthrobacter terrae TaxID=2935737 RepID=A0A931CUS2_9MICC|nr:ComEC/Rec2 family competence protein [Arthrobacter terrae]MBG0740243.1 ComEC/Rec2 family competence protein [Arthrobacter terrae]